MAARRYPYFRGKRFRGKRQEDVSSCFDGFSLVGRGLCFFMVKIVKNTQKNPAIIYQQQGQKILTDHSPIGYNYYIG